jgi:AcrR family transcriptional regulator
MSPVTPTDAPVRRSRDPLRREKIMTAAADLVVGRGFNAVSMSDIGDRVGITAAAIYRHFDSKSALLVALFDKAIDDLLEDEDETRARFTEPLAALTHLVARQVDFVVDEREFARVYHGEVDQLPDEDRARLRRKQRRYLEEWVRLLRVVRPELGVPEARTLVRCGIGAVQAPLFAQVELPPAELRTLLTATAHQVLGLPG